MVQAQWDNMIWWMSSESIRSLGSIGVSRELDIEKNEDAEGQPPSQTVRMKLEEVTISYTVSRAAGVDPANEYAEWSLREGAGIHAPLYINGYQWLRPEFIIKKLDYQCEQIDGNGKMITATITITFQEFRTEGSLIAEKSHYVTPSPGVMEYRGNERERALRVTADQMAKSRGQTL